MTNETSFEKIDPADIEEARLAALAAQALDTSPEPVFDSIANAAALMTGCPIALVSFMERDRQWFKAKCGFSEDSTNREISFCAYAVDGRQVVESLDMSVDPRFKDNPFVAGEERVRYYLGVPVKAPNGQVLGTICVIDRKPRESTNEEIVSALQGLALAIEQILTSRSIMRQQNARLQILAEVEQRLASSDPDLEVISQIGLDSDEPRPRKWTRQLIEEFADSEDGARTRSESKDRNQWRVVVNAAARGLAPAAKNKDVEVNVEVEDLGSYHPPVIFARVVFATLRQALEHTPSGEQVDVRVERKAGFVLYSVSFPGAIANADGDLARWMRTVGGILNVKNQGGRAALLAWFPIV